MASDASPIATTVGRWQATRRGRRLRPVRAVSAPVATGAGSDDVPILGTALKLSEQIFIDRGDTSSAVEELARHMKDSDALICFFPEGHRSSTRQMLPFKKGGAAFAIASQMAVLPMAVSGSDRVIANHSIIANPGPIHVALAKPIETAGMTDDDRGELTERVRREIQAMLTELEGPPPAPAARTHGVAAHASADQATLAS